MKRVLFPTAALLVLGAPVARASHQTDPNLCVYADSTAVWHGTSGNDSFNGAGKADCPDGKAGNDTMHGNGNADEMLGSGGNDYMYVDAGGDWQAANGGDGRDSVYGDAGLDFLYGGADSDFVIEGFGGADQLFGGGFCDETNYYGFAPLSVDNTDPCGVDGFDYIYGGDGNDFIWESNSDTKGDGQQDYINGGAGNDDCTAEAIDTVLNCETIHIIPTGP